jgi:hypothetical protein
MYTRVVPGFTLVWKKVDGQWKVLSDINSSEVQGPM